MFDTDRLADALGDWVAGAASLGQRVCNPILRRGSIDWLALTLLGKVTMCAYNTA